MLIVKRGLFSGGQFAPWLGRRGTGRVDGWLWPEFRPLPAWSSRVHEMLRGPAKPGQQGRELEGL